MPENLSRGRRTAVLLHCGAWLLLAAPQASYGQWTAIRLHNDADFRYSRVYGITPTQQFGYALSNVTPINLRPIVWNSANTGWGSLSALPSDAGRVLGIGGGQQVGDSSITGGASLWSGTAASLVNLRPFNAWDSHALAADGQRQAGYYIQNPGGYQQAVMWTGSAASALSLHPAGAQQSTVTAVADGLEGGWVVYPAGNAPRWAALWSGSASSVTILNPGPSYIDSTIQGMAQGQQVGWAQVFGFNTHAALWRGTAASYVDMNPPGAFASFLYGTCGSAQVGEANVPGLGNTAGVWFGTPESFVPLAAFLPAGYFQSRATCVAEANGTFYVGGCATNSVTGQDEAFMWTGVPGPGGVGVAICSVVLYGRRRRS